MLAAVGAGAGAGAILLGSRGDGHADGHAVPRFSTDVQTIFDSKCVACHPVAYPYLDLRRDHSYDDLYRVSAATKPAFERVVPHRPDLSYLLIHPPDPSLRGLLTSDERRTIARWIAAGARND